MRNPHDDFEVNIGGTLNVLLAARELGLQRVVYASSASIYGNPRYLPINEDDLTNALTPYSVSKFAGERETWSSPRAARHTCFASINGAVSEPIAASAAEKMSAPQTVAVGVVGDALERGPATIAASVSSGQRAFLARLHEV
jgi:dTDP-4-dehydrorhamnose reductase